MPCFINVFLFPLFILIQVEAVAHFAFLAKQARVCGQLFVLLPKSDILTTYCQLQQCLVVGMNMIS